MQLLDLPGVRLQACVPRLELTFAAGRDVAAQSVLEADDRLLEIGPGSDGLLRAKRQLAGVALAADREHEQHESRAQQQGDEPADQSHAGSDSLR